MNFNNDCVKAEYFIREVKDKLGLYYECPEELQMEERLGFAELFDGRRSLGVLIAFKSLLTGGGILAKEIPNTSFAVQFGYVKNGGEEVRDAAMEVITEAASCVRAVEATKCLSSVAFCLNHEENLDTHEFVDELTRCLDMTYVNFPGFPVPSDSQPIDEPKVNSWLMLTEKGGEPDSRSCSIDRLGEIFDPTKIGFGKAFFARAASRIEKEYGIHSATIQARPKLIVR